LLRPESQNRSDERSVKDFTISMCNYTRLHRNTILGVLIIVEGLRIRKIVRFYDSKHDSDYHGYHSNLF